MILPLKDDIYEVKGSLDYIRPDDGKKFTYTHWYVAVENGIIQGAEGYPNSLDLGYKSFEEIKNLYDTLVEDKWVQHRHWLEEEFKIDFEEWVRFNYCDKKDSCKWHEMPIDYEETIALSLATANTIPDAVQRATKNVKTTMREWPNCQGDPLEVGVRFLPADKQLNFFWDCKKHGK